MISVGGTFSIPLGTGVEFDFAPRKGSTLARGALPLREYIADDENALLRTLLPALERNDATFRPLVLYGPTGTGKTTLALALAKRFKEIEPHARLMIVTAADFARAYAHAVETDAVADFRQRLLLASLLVLDDVQHLEGKTPAQGELRQLLEHAGTQATRVIVTSRAAPQELSFSADLCGRLMQGLVLPLRWPGPAARREIVARYLENRRGEPLAEATIDRLAEAYAGSPARLFAGLAQLLHSAEVERRRFDDRFVTEALEEQVRPEIQPRAIIAAVAKQFGVTVKALKGPSRRQKINEARGVAMYLLRRLTKETFEQIGAHFSGRDHTTVMHACQKTTERMSADPQLHHAIERLAAQLQEGA